MTDKTKSKIQELPHWGLQEDIKRNEYLKHTSGEVNQKFINAVLNERKFYEDKYREAKNYSYSDTLEDNEELLDLTIKQLPRLPIRSPLLQQKTKRKTLLPISTSFRFKYIDISTFPVGDIREWYPTEHASMLVGGKVVHGRKISILSIAKQTTPYRWLPDGKKWHFDPYVVGSFGYRVYFNSDVTIYTGEKIEYGTVIAEVERYAGQSVTDLGL